MTRKSAYAILLPVAIGLAFRYWRKRRNGQHHPLDQGMVGQGLSQNRPSFLRENSPVE